jgi:hypothetical protein
MADVSQVDAGKATEIVREYFEKAHGPFGTMLFRVEKVETDKDGQWVVECSFFTSMAGRQRDYYRITISATGNILDVKKVKQAP